MDHLKLIKAVVIAAGSLLASSLGMLALPVFLMVVCNIVDWISGLMAAPYRGQKISSDLAKKGMIRKVALWLLVLVGVIIDELLIYAAGTLNIELHVRFLVGCVVAVWIICNELLSILENVNDCGAPIPKFLTPLVKYIRSQVEEKIDCPEKDPSGTNEEDSHAHQ